MKTDKYKNSNRYFIMIGEELSMWYWQLFIFYFPIHSINAGR